MLSHVLVDDASLLHRDNILWVRAVVVKDHMVPADAATVTHGPAGQLPGVMHGVKAVRCSLNAVLARALPP